MHNNPVVYLLRDAEVLKVKREWLPGKASPGVSFAELCAGCPVKGLALSSWKKIPQGAEWDVSARGDL